MPDTVRDRIIKTLSKLSDNQVAYVDAIVTGMARSVSTFRLPSSDIASECFVERFGIELLGHHSVASKAMNKLQFEYAMERVLNICKRSAQLAPAGNPGHDITIDSVPCSLKTQSNADIRADVVWISKFM